MTADACAKFPQPGSISVTPPQWRIPLAAEAKVSRELLVAPADRGLRHGHLPAGCGGAAGDLEHVEHHQIDEAAWNPVGAASSGIGGGWELAGVIHPGAA